MQLHSKLSEIERSIETAPEEKLLRKIQNWVGIILGALPEFPKDDPSSKHVQVNSFHFLREAYKHSENYFKEPYYNPENNSSIYPSNLAVNSFKRAIKFLKHNLNSTK